MATEQVTTTYIWCDTHSLDDGDRVTGETFYVSVAGPDGTGGSFTIDLCAACGKPVVDVLDMLREYGRPARGKSPRAVASGDSSVSTGTPHPCPVETCDYVGGSRKRLDSHARHTHGYTVAELDGSASIPCPVDGCPRKFVGNVGAVAHLNTAHPDQPEVLAAFRRDHVPGHAA